MNNFTIKETPIKDLVIIEPKVFGDERGFFQETYNKESFAELGLNMEFVQDNHSKSKKGVLRGLHFQTKNVQGKLVRVTRGAVYDVAVDLRTNSPTFGEWYGVLLTEKNKIMFFLGFFFYLNNTHLQTYPFLVQNQHKYFLHKNKILQISLKTLLL